MSDRENQRTISEFIFALSMCAIAVAHMGWLDGLGEDGNGGAVTFVLGFTGAVIAFAGMAGSAKR